MITVDFKHAGVTPATTIHTNLPLFAQYTPALAAIESLAKKYKKKKNIVVIGNGGSITSFSYFVAALGTKKNIHIISTMEPDVLKDVRLRCKKQDTVVIVVSKSGNNVGVIESLMFFADYPTIAVTEDKRSALREIQQRNKWDYIEHPPIGGRYSGFSPSGLLPAAIAGIDIRRIWKGASQAYAQYAPSRKLNNAATLASAYFQLDKKGFSEIFMPIYSSHLLGSKDIVTQLVHESAGKEGKGLTLFAAFAPESQHHTNQRFFGGKKNMLGTFVIVDELEQKYDRISIPRKLQDIKIQEGTLKNLNENYYAHALHAEFVGTLEDAVQHKIPCITIALNKITPETIGAYLAFWHWVVVYLCVLYGVDPFDQPQVETSKMISFKERLK